MTPSPPPRLPRNLPPWLFLPALLLLVTLAYWPGRGGGFVFDDYPNIVDNGALHVTTLDWPAWLAAAFSSPASDLQRPLSMLSFAINHYFTGLAPAPMKLANVGIHLVNALLVAGLLRTLLALVPGPAATTRHRWTARFTTAAWALHPINLMAVLFVVQRMESLSHTFVFAGLWLYLLGRRRQLDGERGWAPIVAGLVLGTGLGVLAKESAVLLPLYAFCVELCLLGFRGGTAGRRRSLMVLFALLLFVPAAVGLAWLLPKALAPGAFAIRDFTLGERLLTEGRVVFDYLRWTLLPDLGQLSLYHDDYPVSRGLLAPPATLFALLALAGLAAGAWWLRRRRPLASLGLAWFLAAHLLTGTFLPLELVYEHRNYFASLGLCLALADLLLLVPRGESARRIGALFALLVVVGYAGTTHLRAREWSDPYRFASSEAAKHPGSPRAAYALGQALVVMTEYRSDSPLLVPAREALERAAALEGSGILPHSGLILLAANTGMPQQRHWWDDMQQRLRQDRIGPQEINAIGSLVRCARDTCRLPADWMEETFAAARAGGDVHPELLHLHGDYVLNVHGDAMRALDLWRAASRMDPRQHEYRVSLAKLLIAMGRDDDARAAIASLRSLGRLGQYAGVADSLQARLAASKAARERVDTGKSPP